MKTEIVTYSEGPVILDAGKWAGMDHENISVTIQFIVRYSTLSDYVGVQVDCAFDRGGEEPIKLGLLVGIRIDGWSQAFKDGKNPTTYTDLTKEYCGKVWLVATGVLARKSVEMNVHPVILPGLDLDKAAADVIFIDNTTRAKE